LPSNSKNKILNAAETIALREGAPHLTIDAVAAEAGLSKGGVLYNYPTKEALIKGMVERLIEQTENSVAALAAQDPEPRGRLLRSYVKVTFPEGATDSARVNQVCAVLLSAILTNPDLLQPVRAHFRAMQDRLMDDGLDAQTVNLVRLACDGLWLSEMLRMPGPEGPAREALIRKFYAMTKGN
jgi:AcrR family transcriptional regulator